MMHSKSKGLQLIKILPTTPHQIWLRTSLLGLQFAEYVGEHLRTLKPLEVRAEVAAQQDAFIDELQRQVCRSLALGSLQASLPVSKEVL